MALRSAIPAMVFLVGVGGASFGGVDPPAMAVALRAAAQASRPGEPVRPGWWSFRPVERPGLPEVLDEGWARNEIDRFVLARLEEHGLRPAPEADRRTLIRRLYFDLLGLPPTPEEVEAFAAEDSPDAYERLVDRLLDSPHYGERWARHWLDVVRFGESQGVQRNWLRPEAWKYRDWVILAFNDDLPYGEFVRRQLAGDLLYPDDPSAAVATGYQVLGLYDLEGDIQGSDRMMRQVRQEELADNVATLGQTFLGLTIHCARCHDHKFDPIPQREYYQLASALGTFRHNRGLPREVAGLAEDSPRRAPLREEIAVLRERMAEIEGVLRDELHAEAAAELERERDLARADLAGKRQTLRDIARQAPTQWVDAETGEAVPAPAPKSPLRRLLRPKFALSIASLAACLGLISLRGFRDRVRGAIRPSLATGGIALALAGVIVRGLTPPRTMAEVAEDRAGARAVEERPIKDNDHFLAESNIRYAEAALDEVAARTPNVTYAEILDRLPPEPQDEYRELVRVASALEMRDGLLAGGATHAVVPTEAPVGMRVLRRGTVDDPGETVSPGGVAALGIASSDFGLPPDASDAERRPRLADWIADPANPLAPRVIVNRLWQRHFGRGIVATPSDFGAGGELPSHPELLDWLASEFLAGERRLKPLHRAMVTSATYRQSSRPRPDALAADPDNRWLWRMSKRRHDAEVVRDAMLATAGRLSPQIGGPGYRDFAWQPSPGSGEDAGYTPIDVFGPRFFRRTIYRTWVRGADNALLATLDCADPNVATPARVATTTPLQALSLLNDSFVTSAAAEFAARVEREAGGDRDAQATRAWRLALHREPDAEELLRAAHFAEEFGLAQLCLVLFNTNEFLYLH